MNSVFRRCISFSVLVSILAMDMSLPSSTVFAYEHSLDELPGYHSLEELPSYEYEAYASTQTADDSVLDALPSVQAEKRDPAIHLHSKPRGRKIALDMSTKLMMDTGSLAPNNLTVEFPAGVVIQSASGSFLDPSLIGVKDLDKDEDTKARRSMKLYQGERSLQKNRIVPKKKAFLDMIADAFGPSEVFAGESVKFQPDTTKTFEFGIPGEHLIFSKPVKISMNSDFRDGTYVDVLVLHAGDADYNTEGLSTDVNTRCNADGTATAPSSTAVVKNGKVTFYTCGASSYTMNPTGGVTGSNDLRLVIGDCGQFQLYYNGAANIYTGDPPATGCTTNLGTWINLRIGATTYGASTYTTTSTAWTTNTTTGSQIGNTYTGITTLTRVVGGLTYTGILNWKYTAPNKFFTIDWSIAVPAGNTNNVRFYIGNDTTVGGADANDVGYTGSVPSATIGVFDNVLNQLSAVRYLSGLMWTAQEAGPYATVASRITGGTNFANTIQTTAGDLGFGINWDFGTGAGTRTGSIEWRMLPYVAATVPDPIPGIGSPSSLPMQVGVDSILPITVTNAGNASSTGVHTMIVSYSGILMSGPLTPFSSNGWSCGAESGATVTCTKNTTITPLGSDTFDITVRPKPAASGLTARFDVSLSNAGDSNTSNNTAFSTFVVAVTPPPADTTPPVVSSISPLTGSLLPTGNNITVSFNYSDTGSAINQSTATGTLLKWNTGSSTWITQTGVLTATTINSGSAIYTSSGRSFGKYRFDVSVQDNQGNTRTGSTTFYIDQLEWNVSTPIHDLGDMMTNTTRFSTGEIIVTVRTVGAPFTVTMNDGTLLTYSGNTIGDWDGTKGYGYEKFNGVAYSGVISTINPWQNIQSQGASINTTGDQNTYTYRLKIGALVQSDQVTGQYVGDISFRIVATY